MTYQRQGKSAQVSDNRIYGLNVSIETNDMLLKYLKISKIQVIIVKDFPSNMKMNISKTSLLSRAVH